MNILAVAIKGRECADRADEHAHRMCIVMEAVHQLLDVLMNHRVIRDVVRPLLVLRFRRQLAVEKQVCDLKKIAFLSKLLDRVTAVAKNSFVAINERDFAFAQRRVHERRVVRHQAKVVVFHFYLSQVHRPDGLMRDGHFVFLASAIVNNRQGVGHSLSNDDKIMYPDSWVYCLCTPSLRNEANAIARSSRLFSPVL